MFRIKPVIFDNKETGYFVTDNGKVFSSKSSKYLKPFIGGRGYLYVHLKVNGIKINYSVHRLVAIAFIPNPENKPTVNHNDCDKKNNNYWNLSWATYSEQNKHMHYMKVKGYTDKYIKNKLPKDNNIPMNIINIIYLLQTTNMSLSEIARKYNVSRSCVTDIYKHKSWKEYTKNMVFKNRDVIYNENLTKIYNLLINNPDLTYKHVIKLLNLEPSLKLKYCIDNMKRRILNKRIDTSSTTNNSLYYTINII